MQYLHAGTSSWAWRAVFLPHCHATLLGSDVEKLLVIDDDICVSFFQCTAVVAHKLWMHPCNDASVLAHNRVTFKWVSIMETFHPIKDLLTNTSVCKQLLGVGIFFTQTFCNSVSIVLQRCLIWFGHQCFLQGVSVCS